MYLRESLDIQTSPFPWYTPNSTRHPWTGAPLINLNARSVMFGIIAGAPENSIPNPR